VGGGIRTDDAVRSVFATGARRVVLGTAALEDPAFAARSINEFGPESVVVAIDVRNGLAVGEGWRQGSVGLPPEDAIHSLADAGARWFAVTAIDRDGLMHGPDIALLEQMVSLDRGSIIASGGISSFEDLNAVRDVGCSGAIIGRAIYEGTLDLRRILARD
jgi:phosphoribosylformimino-5-aminoimidazole carboxamide ribonucleotide (ProFAR) isomerase